MHAELGVGDGGELEKAAEIDDLGELIAGEFAEPVDVAVKGLGVPVGDAGGVGDGFGAMDGVEVEGPGGDASEEAVLGGHDVPGNLHGGFGVGVGAIVAFAVGNGFEDSSGDAVFAFESGESDGV